MSRFRCSWAILGHKQDSWCPATELYSSLSWLAKILASMATLVLYARRVLPWLTARKKSMGSLGPGPKKVAHDSTSHRWSSQASTWKGPRSCWLMGASSGYSKLGPLALKGSLSSHWMGSEVRGQMKGFGALGSLSSSSEGKRPAGLLRKSNTPIRGRTTLA